MASSQHVLLSPAELSYLHSSLSLTPPIRPDGRSPTQYRPLSAETGILPGTNGSARICFADGTEAIVGVKAEVEKTKRRWDDDAIYSENQPTEGEGQQQPGRDGDNGEESGSSEWVELTVEIPGYRDDDSGTIFLGQMLSEALLADGGFVRKLRINRRFHWRLYLDILLISPPLSYPLPLLSLTTHLALLATRLPKLKSEGDEDPFFDDDWAAAPYLYPRDPSNKQKVVERPPVTLLVMAVGGNIIFDPSKEELAVADVALAVSIGDDASTAQQIQGGDKMDVDSFSHGSGSGRNLKLLSIRTVDPPSRLTPPGVANAANSAYGHAQVVSSAGAGGNSQKMPEARQTESEAVEGVWKPPRGGAKAIVMGALVQKVLIRGGVADEVLDALEGVDTS
ncbi:ribosomal protein S5 domain 2-type protein [Apiosordaria backusii]|uniref:Ribosomal RNA-processing protein 42 n=1 Tax=Apiosordaria backusii TaxID=314023 RepID=A0AA40EXW9_9PEZI|nr:ribosomal protein S5 domain 2-type protein [Apiosordaria backusii]